MRLIPNEYANFAYSVNFFRVENGGTIKLQTADGTVTTLTVQTGDYVNLPVRRIYQIGTTASGFQTEMFSNRHTADYYTAVPYTSDPALGNVTGFILLDQGGGDILTDDGHAIYY